MNWPVLWAKLKALEGKVDSLELITLEKVETLPEVGERNVIYLVPKSDPETGNYSDEYIWDSDEETYEQIGDTQVAPIEDYIKDSSIAPLYDNTSTYAVGDIVAYEKELYRCTTAISIAEEWNSAHWTKTDIISEMPVIPPIPADANHNIASAYDATATYDLGDLCIYNGDLYECSTAISTAEEWTAAHWTQKTVAQELSEVGGSDIEIFEGTISGKQINLSNNKKVGDIFNAKSNGKRVFLNADGLLFYSIVGNANSYNLGFVSLNALAPNSSMYNLCIYYAECYSSELQKTYVGLKSPSNTIGYSNIQKIFLQSSNGNYRFYGYSTDQNGAAILVKDRSRLIANMFDFTTTYNRGDLTIDRTSLELYRCNTDNTTGAWDSTKWDQVTVEVLLNAIDYAKDTSVAPLYDSTATYELGDIVMYNKELYECTTAISVAEAWDSTHWTKTDIFSQMPSGGGALSALSDVDLTNPSDEQDLVYNATLGKWINKTKVVTLTKAQYDLLPSSKLTDGIMYYITDLDINDYAKDSSIADLYDNTSTYAVNDIVMFENELYKCTTAVSVAEDFDVNKWTSITVMDIISASITSVLNTSF